MYVRTLSDAIGKDSRRQPDSEANSSNVESSMDDYPAADPIPEPDIYAAQYTTIIEYMKESREMRAATKGSLKQGLWAGSGAVAGGMIFGAVGGLVGGIAGSLFGFFQADDYDGIILQLCKLDERQQQALVKDVGRILVSAGAAAQGLNSVDAFRDALIAFASQRQVRDDLWSACLTSLQE